LQAVLTDGLSTLTPAPPPIAEVHDLQGTISTSPARLMIFLFEAKEDPSQRNRRREREAVPATGILTRRPPMAALLRYLLIPWSGDRLTDQRILGRTMQVLYDHAILAGPQLEGGLAGTSEALKVTLAPLTLEELYRVWHAVQKPYRLSLTYEVRVVNVDTEAVVRSWPVSARELVHGVGEGDA
jgi:hypothetical protein